MITPNTSLDHWSVKPAHRNFPPCDLPIDPKRYEQHTSEAEPSLFREDEAYHSCYGGSAQSQNLAPAPLPYRYRDPDGRYSTEMRSRLLNAEQRAARCARMIVAERRRSFSFSVIIRLKDETIAGLRAEIKKMEEEIAKLTIKNKCMVK